jgi:hypothetical protein
MSEIPDEKTLSPEKVRCSCSPAQVLRGVRKDPLYYLSEPVYSFPLGVREGRGIEGLKLIDGVEISTMSQLKEWVVESDKVLTF